MDSKSEFKKWSGPCNALPAALQFEVAPQGGVVVAQSLPGLLRSRELLDGAPRVAEPGRAPGVAISRLGKEAAERRLHRRKFFPEQGCQMA